MSQPSLMDQVQQQPDALKTTVAITGVISLSDEDADRFDATNKVLSAALMELSVLSNNQEMPGLERAERLLALKEPVMTSLDAILMIMRTAASELTTPRFSTQGRSLVAEVTRYHDHVRSGLQTFQSMEQSKQGETALDCSRDTSNGVLTVLEKCIELFATIDHSTVAAIDNACKLTTDGVCSIQAEFIGGRSQDDIRMSFQIDPSRAKALIDASQVFVTNFTSALRAFANRLPVIISPEAKTELQDGMNMLQTAVPQLLNAAQGNVPDDGFADSIINFLKRAPTLVRKVPPFSARVLAEFVDGSALRIAHANLGNAVQSGSVADIGESARKYAVEVSRIVAQCRAMGVDPMECDIVQAALADVLRLAKIASTTGSPEDIKKFQAALEYLTSLAENLPKKFTRKLFDESTSALDAARNMSKGALLDLVKGMGGN